MADRLIYDDELHAQFVTFSCYRRRRLLDHQRARQIVISILADELKKQAGLAAKAVDWRWSSARHYERGESVGVPIT